MNFTKQLFFIACAFLLTLSSFSQTDATQEEDKLSVKERSGLTSHMLNTPLRDKKREKNHSTNS